ncbi:MAG: polysaccharide biosynthesis protein [Prevotella sp.]|nr:polysaccharide biosynthesis protein [Prevotella sp.]
MNTFHKLCNWYFSKKALPYWCILLIDCASVYLSGLIVFYIQHGGLTLAQRFWPLTLGLLLCLGVYMVSFILFHTFKGVIRYSSFVDLHRVVYSTLAATVGVCLLHQVQVHAGLTDFILIPRFDSAFLVFVLSTCLLCGTRVLVKSLHDTYRGNDTIKRVFVYGSMEGGIALAKSIRAEVPARFKLCGFVSNKQNTGGMWLLGEKVYEDNDNLLDIIKEKQISVILVSPLTTEKFTKRTSLIDGLVNAGVKIMMMPPAEEWDGKSDLSHRQLHEVDIEELLPREKIEVDMDAIGNMLRGKRILITGAAGSIGSEMSRQVAKFNPSELVLVDQAETPMHDVRLYMARNHNDLKVWTIVGSITNKEQMERIFSEHKPEYVFHAAAYKHVPMMEDNPAMAVQNNIYGTRVIADLAVKYGTKKFVMISTDKAVNPTNVMGCSKRICEIYCQSLDAHQDTTQFITTRFGNVLGSNGSVIPIFKEQIRKGGPVTVTHPDIIRFFMLIPEACRLVLEAGTMGKGGEIFVFDMGEAVKIVDLAKRMIKLSGAKDIEIKFSGLREGEKLYEEVLNDAEQTKPTVHPKIKVAAVREYPYKLALQNEIELYNLSTTFDDMAIVKKMKEIVPEYKSQHSKYMELDNL